MDRRALALVLGVALCAACSDDQLRRIAIDVKTDYVADREFALITVYGGAATEGTQPTFTADIFALPGEAFDLGVRVGVADRIDGPMYFEADIYDADALDSDDPFIDPFAYTVVMLEDRTIPALTLVISRSCDDIDCLVGPDRTPQMCRGGACTDIHCAAELPETCGPPQCTSDADCVPAFPCVRARCDEGVCLGAARDQLCPAGQVCDPTMGCVAP